MYALSVALTILLDLMLIAVIGAEVTQFPSRYRNLKEEIAQGKAGARIRVYCRVLTFEASSAMLAMLSLGLHWSRLNPRGLGLGAGPFTRLFGEPEAIRGVLEGALGGIAAGTVAMAAFRLWTNRRPLSGGAAGWRKLLPDFSALIPVTGRERLLWCAVAVSAGVCEEIVFRGWLMALFHQAAGLRGSALVAASAAVFGLAHWYQRLPGILLTGLAGALFCLLYLQTGSLLLPMLLHSLIDLRIAILPAPAPEKRRTARPEAAG
jgi:membrane protease YdiL (CAAX protease family)